MSNWVVGPIGFRTVTHGVISRLNSVGCQFLSRVSTLTCDIDIATLSVCLSVRPSVRPSVRFSVLVSVTIRYSMETVGGSPIILVS